MTVSVDTYLLAAEYWHPDVYEPWIEVVLRIAAEDVEDTFELDVAFAELDDECDVRCWYYLLKAAEVSP